jgi:hypothetical protein
MREEYESAYSEMRRFGGETIKDYTDENKPEAVKFAQISYANRCVEPNGWMPGERFTKFFNRIQSNLNSYWSIPF